MSLAKAEKENLAKALSKDGMRLTRHREQVYEVLVNGKDHPVADDIYARAKEISPNISLATVYNCLDSLVDCGLVQRLNYAREPSRYCAGKTDHAHFFDQKNGVVYDIDLPCDFQQKLLEILPEGFVAQKVKLSFSGHVSENFNLENHKEKQK